MKKKPQSISSFYTFDSHNDYVRSMAFSAGNGRLFSVSDDGLLTINDLHQGRVVEEFLFLKQKNQKFSQIKGYMPVYSVSKDRPISIADTNLLSF